MPVDAQASGLRADQGPAPRDARCSQMLPDDLISSACRSAAEGEQECTRSEVGQKKDDRGVRYKFHTLLNRVVEHSNGCSKRVEGFGVDDFDGQIGLA